MPDEKKDNTVQGEKTSGMNAMDVLAIIACWGGVAAVTYFSKEPVVAVIAIAAAYYLAKWVILKRER